MTGAPLLYRRAALRAGAGLLASGLAATTTATATVATTSLLAGCGPSRGGGVEMAIGWGGNERQLFDRALEKVSNYHRHRVDVTPVTDDIDAFLRTRHRAGNLPDVAVVPRPGLVRQYVGNEWLEPLDDLADRFSDPWNELVTVDGHVHGVWLRAAHKSLFWYQPRRLPELEGQPPRTWPGLVELVDDLADRGRTPLAVGAADGWVLTDWLDNLLAARADQTLHRQLADGEPLWHSQPVRTSLRELADIWSIDRAFPGGGRRALLTQFDQSVMQVAVTGEALLLFEADFVRSKLTSFGDEGSGDLRPFPFPSPTARAPLVVAGDIAVVRKGSQAGLELVDWFTRGRVDAFQAWRRHGGYLSPNLLIASDRYPPVERELVQAIREPGPDTEMRFDLSDLLPGELNGADGVGSWRVLQDFFARVTERDRDDEETVDAAIEAAVTGLNDIAERVRAQASGEERR